MGLESKRMEKTRRGFLESTAGLAAALAAAPSAAGQVLPPAAVQVPKVKFGKAEISRIVLGMNPLYGVSHFNNAYNAVMREWYTSARIVEIMHRCASYGINCYQAVSSARCVGDYERFQSEGGKMHVVVQTTAEPAEVVKALKPLAIYHAGEYTDNAWRDGKMDSVRDYCKRVRQSGAMVGVGSHIPEVLAFVEDAGWDVDFYAGCVYNRRRTPEEFRKLLGGELPEMTNEIYLQDDPPRMYKVMKQTAKPCFAFKVLAAGRVRSPEAAFKLAFDSLKPNDCIFVGMFPRAKDEIKEDSEIVSRILKTS